jgi:leader peptidase (prepilin peptidase)/N-methyltransferase
VITPFDSLLIFVLGLIFGSFLNVVIYRYNTGSASWRIVGGRSQCLSCGKLLRWYELIPVFSFLFQQGRCSGCGSKISWQYPLVELLTGLSFLLVWQLPLPLVSKSVYLLIVLLLVVIAAYDFRHLIIPDAFVYSFIILALAHAIWLGDFLSYFLTGLGLAAFFWILWLVSRGRWLGFADGKLALGIGFLLGPALGVSAVVLAFWIGAVAGVALIIVSRLSARYGYVTMKSELPFAPFLILGLALTIFLNLNVLPF